MKKHHVLMLLPVLVWGLTGCNEESTTSPNTSLINNSSSLPTTSEEYSSSTAEEVPTSSVDSSSGEISSPSSSEKTNDKEDISSIVEYCQTLKGSENEQGCVIGTKMVTFEGHLTTYNDMITSSSGYLPKYAYSFVDSTGYIFAHYNDNKYSPYANGSDSLYRVKGYASLYLGQPCVKVSSIEWKEGKDTEITKDIISSFATSYTNISDLYDYTTSLSINKKGTRMGNLVKVRAKYIAKINNSVIEVYDGNNVLRIHGNSKINNGLTINNVYDFVGFADMYMYAPSLEYVQSTFVEQGETEVFNSTLVTAANFGKIQKTNDSTAHVKNYEAAFKKVFRIEGYVNYYWKDGRANMILTDSYQSSSFDTINNVYGSSNKSVIFSNDSEQKLTSANYSALKDYVNTNTKVSLCFVADFQTAFNNTYYWSVSLLSSSLAEVNV